MKEVVIDPKIIILGHETENGNNIPDEIINQYLKNYPKYKYFKVSAKTNMGIQEALHSMIDLLDNEDNINRKLFKYLDF